jgi:zinc protease
LVITGDVEHNKVFALAQKIWGDWPNSGFNPHEKYPIPDFQPLKNTVYFIKESSIAQTPFMLIDWQGPEYRNDSASTLYADIFSTILGLNSSRWQQALVDKGLATFAGFNYGTTRYVGDINAFIVPNPNKLKECYQEVINQINHFSDPDYVTEEQLQTAKEVFYRNEIRNNEKPSTLGSQVTFWWASTSLDYFTDYVPNLMKVTRQDLTRFINKYIKDKPFVAGMIINQDMNKKFNAGEYFKN